MSQISDEEVDSKHTTLGDMLIILVMWGVVGITFLWAFVSEPFRKNKLKE